MFKTKHPYHEPLTAAAGWGIGAAAGALLGTGADLYAKAKMNKKTRQWNEKMYGIQRQDALADWQLQNQYNSPAAQMERLKEAGLSPMLVYGGGANQVSQPVRSSDFKQWNPEVPQVGRSVQDTIGTYFNVQMQKAQLDNLRLQATILEEQGAGISLDNAIKEQTYDIRGTGFEWKKQDRPYDLQLKKGQVAQQDAQIQKILADMDLNTSRYNIQRSQASVQMRKDEQAILNMIEQNVSQKLGQKLTGAQYQKLMVELDNLKTSGKILGVTAELAEKTKRLNLQPGDPAIMRLFMGVADKFAEMIKRK